MLFLPLFLASFTFFFAIYLLRPFALRVGLVDIPNNRKLHKGHIPLIGGIAMYIAAVVGIFVSPFELSQYKYFLLSSSIVILFGSLDDYRSMSISLRLIFQLLVSLILVVIGDVQIHSLGNLLGGGEIILSEWTNLFSVLALIFAMNAVNMSDGMHGLAGGNSLITYIAIIYLSLGSTSYENLLVLCLFCSILPVFLMHNLCLGIHESKRVFMGDAGSMLLGLVASIALIDFSQGENRSFSPVIALWLFGIPLFEMVITIFRRFFSGNSPFAPDLFHLHHLLIGLGYDKNTLMLIIGVSFSMALVGVLGEINGVSEFVMFYGFLLTFVSYVIFYVMSFRKIQRNSN